MTRLNSAVLSITLWCSWPLNKDNIRFPFAIVKDDGMKEELMLKSKIVDGTTMINGKFKKLAYADEFRQLLRTDKGIISATFKLFEKASANYNPGKIVFPGCTVSWNRIEQKWQITERCYRGKLEVPEPMDLGRGTFLKPGRALSDRRANLRVTLLGISNRNLQSSWHNGRRLDKSNYYKVDWRGQSFFAKRSWITTNPGYFEFCNTIIARRLLANLDFVSVATPLLGFQSRRQSLFVSSWQELEGAGFASLDSLLTSGGINDYGILLEEICDAMEKDQYDRMTRLARWIEAVLKIDQRLISDLAHNLFYNPRTERFVLLDVTGTGGEFVGNPIRYD